MNHAAETKGRITDVFAPILGEDGVFIAHQRKVDDMRVNGVRIGDRRAALSRAGEPGVTEAYQSSVMAAEILLSLGYDSTSAEIVRRAEDDPPDLELVFRTGPDRRVYAEFSRLCNPDDESMQKLTWRLDAALKAVGAIDVAFAGALADRSVHIDFRTRPVTRPTERQLLEEITRFVLSYDPKTRALVPCTSFDASYPALHSLAATFWWSDRAWIGGNFVRLEVPDFGLATLVAAANARIAAKANKYPQRPLWLLLSVSESWRESVWDLFAGMRDGSIVFHAPNFDRLVIGVTGDAVGVPPL